MPRKTKRAKRRVLTHGGYAQLKPVRRTPAKKIHRLNVVKIHSQPSNVDNVRELITYLYLPAKNWLKKRLGNLVYENNLLHGSPQMYGEIIWEGKNYSYNLGDQAGYFPAHFPHERIKEQFLQYLQDREEIDREVFHCEQFMPILFNFVQDTDELRDLLGESLYGVLSKRAPDALEDLEKRIVSPVYSDNFRGMEIKEFLDEYGKYIKMLQDRILDNVLSDSLYNAGSEAS